MANAGQIRASTPRRGAATSRRTLPSCRLRRMRTVGYWPGAVMPAGLDVRSSAGRSRAFPKGIGVSFPLLIRLSVIADEFYALPGADTTFRPGRLAGATVSRSPPPAAPPTDERGRASWGEKEGK